MAAEVAVSVVHVVQGVDDVAQAGKGAIDVDAWTAVT